MSFEQPQNFSETIPVNERIKLPIDVSYEKLEQEIPEVMAMKGFDQRNDFHDLTLDEHTKELVFRL